MTIPNRFESKPNFTEANRKVNTSRVFTAATISPGCSRKIERTARLVNVDNEHFANVCLDRVEVQRNAMYNWANQFFKVQ